MFRELLLLYSSLHFLPSMRAEQEAVFHSVHHLNETAERDGEAQLILPDPWSNRRVKETEEATMALPLVFHNCH